MKIKDLVGKTIVAVTEMKKPNLDDKAWLELKFTDDTSCVIKASYGGYTGNSEDEYPAYITIEEVPKELDELVPVTRWR